MVPKKRNKKQTIREEKKSKIRALFSLIFISIFLLIVLVVSVYLFVIPSVLESSFEEKNIVIISSKLDLQSNFIYFAHLSEHAEDSVLFRLNSNEAVVVPGGYGEYPLQSVYPLLKIDKKDDQFIRYAYSQLLGISVDEVVAIEEPLIEETDKNLRLILLQSALQQILSFSFQDVSELLDIHYKVSEIKRDELESLEDVSQYYVELSTIRGDLYQYCSTAVINATGKNGVASAVGQLIENTGGLVVRLDDAKSDAISHEGSVVMYYSDEVIDCMRMAEKVFGLFSTKPVVLPISELENSSQYRSKVVIFIRDH